jgi:hypothetical protein
MVYLNKVAFELMTTERDRTTHQTQNPRTPKKPGIEY